MISRMYYMSKYMIILMTGQFIIITLRYTSENEKFWITSSSEGSVNNSVEYTSVVPIYDSEVKFRKYGYMKTHKTGSSTFAHVLYRYGFKHMWNFAMPPVGRTFGDCETSFRASMARGTAFDDMIQDQGLNVIALHTQWNYAEFSSLMGKGTFFVTSVRRPVDQFVSAYNFSGMVSYKTKKYFSLC